tara:strand:+ start:581 stop:1174 length:594 start_codon:yes stop_codon:yes gene_type:complete
MDISSYPTIDAQSIDLAQDLVFISNQENVAASSIAETLLEKRNISKKTSYYFRTVHLNVEPRQSKLNFLTSLNVANLLSSDSGFVCNVEFFVDLKQSFVSVGDGPLYDRKTVTLPSLTIQKNFGNKFISVRSSEYASSIDVGSSSDIAMSKIHYNNNDYNLRCLLSTTSDSIRFDYISYTRNQIFDTRINFTFESTQ